MAHAGRKLPIHPPSNSRAPILWAEDCVANGGPLPEMNAFGLPRKAVAGPYLAPVSFQGATALHLAAFYGHSGVTDLLLAAMACDVTACNVQVCHANLAGHICEQHARTMSQFCRQVCWRPWRVMSLPAIYRYVTPNLQGMSACSKHAAGCKVYWQMNLSREYIVRASLSVPKLCGLTACLM